jgi:hypothetical protein
MSITPHSDNYLYCLVVHPGALRLLVRHLYHLSRPTIRKPGHQMSKSRVASAALFAVLLSPVPAMPQAVSRSYSADFYVGGCKDFLAANSSFFAGRCVGAVEVLDALNDDTKLFCPPEGVTNLQRVQVVVDYIKMRPDRKSADFRLVANEAMAKAWPCKK